MCCCCFCSFNCALFFFFSFFSLCQSFTSFRITNINCVMGKHCFGHFICLCVFLFLFFNILSEVLILAVSWANNVLVIVYVCFFWCFFICSVALISKGKLLNAVILSVTGQMPV